MDAKDRRQPISRMVKERKTMMRMDSIVLASAMLACLLSCRSNPVQPSPERLLDACETVANVVGHPSKYEGKAGHYCGYFRDDYPVMAIYSDIESARKGDFARRISSRYSDCIVGSGGTGLEAYNGKIVKLTAIFHREDVETSGLSAGSFSTVTEIVLDGRRLTCDNYKIILAPAQGG